MHKIILVIITSIAIAGCVGAGQNLPEKRNINNIKTISSSYEKTWNSIIEFFAVNNTPLEKINKGDGLITSSRHLRTLDELDCGQATGQISWASAKMENIGGNINVVVRSIKPEKTKVIVSVFGSGDINIRNAYGNSLSSQEARCVSTGAFEKSLFSYLENK